MRNATQVVDMAHVTGGRPRPTAWRRLVSDQTGQELIEYGLLIGIITVGAIGAIASIGPTVAGYFTTLESNLP